MFLNDYVFFTSLSSLRTDWLWNTLQFALPVSFQQLKNLLCSAWIWTKSMVCSQNVFADRCFSIVLCCCIGQREKMLWPTEVAKKLIFQYLFQALSHREFFCWFVLKKNTGPVHSVVLFSFHVYREWSFRRRHYGKWIWKRTWWGTS